MPQLDSETLVTVSAAGGSTDRKIACETIAHDHESETHPDSPPESIWLSRDEEYDWVDRNAVYERKESTKGNSNSDPNYTNLNRNPNNQSNSRRFSSKFKSKASIIGLPKPQKPSLIETKRRRRRNSCSTTLFPKGSASVGKSVSSLKEPSSPKVSCTGKVRSMRDRNRRLRNSRRSTNSEPVRTGRKPRFFESFLAIFRCGLEEKPEKKTGSAISVGSVNEKKVMKPRYSVNDCSYVTSISRNSVLEGEPPGLGQMNRLACGRRSESSGVGESQIHVSR
ncbi:hypothetical protein TanjilG_31132 [Lupinus angustifolius]|uniref:Uncharacterized protein n=1 Tax=Lupinus angustifolius TaxID=3871 RepID=A0A1J7FVV3_LUPAN|nr:PREDICTED: uncharacterized protein LOC109333850 [Lupinus angustifolius]OIV92213.1 hypothetical protein TanjilG_31132 [Lupinus angustifolius]